MSSHPLVHLSESWLNPLRYGSARYPDAYQPYYNRTKLARYEVDWYDLWCDGYYCPSCSEYWGAGN